MRHLQLAPNRLRFIIVMLLMVGIFFRFFNLDRKVYWHDETFTSLRISGYTVNEVKQQIFNGRIINNSRFAHFFWSSRNCQKSEKSRYRNGFSDFPKFP